MNGNWSTKWKSVLIWACGYLNFLAFALVGGYCIVKDEDQELKKTVKTAFIVTLIFAAVSAFLSLFSGIGGMFDGWYGSGAYEFYSVAVTLNSIAKIIVYAIFIVKGVYEAMKPEGEKKENE